MANVSTQQTFQRRFRYARPWLLIMLLVGIATFVVGQYWIFADSDCPQLQILLLVASTFLAWLLMSIQAIFAKSNSPLSQLMRVAGVFVLGIVLTALSGMGLYQIPDLRSQICPTCEKYTENAGYLRTVALNDANPLSKLDGAELYGRNALSTCGKNMKPTAADVLAHVLFDQAGAYIKNGECTRADQTLKEASQLARDYTLDPNFVQAIQERDNNRKVACEPKPTSTWTPTPTQTPTSTPTSTRTPTSTPTSTPLPTLTAVPPDKPKIDEPCKAIRTSPPTEIITLTLPIAQVGPKSLANGVFFTSPETVVSREFQGNELVCLGSTRDGLGALMVDDRLDFFVYSDGSLRGQWGHDFYDPKSGGISEFRAEDVSNFFRQGRYRVKLVLTDLHPQYYSSSSVYLVIWRP